MDKALHYLTLVFLLFFTLISEDTQARPPYASYGSPVMNHDFGKSRTIRNSNDLLRNYDWGLYWGAGDPNHPVANEAEWQNYTPLTSNNYIFTSNTLKLIARFNRDNGNNRISKGEITSGGLRSKRKFKPTASKSFYFEARMKIPEGKGLWPAFWLYRHGGGGNAEIDIVEVVNNQWDSSKSPRWSPLVHHNNLHSRSGRQNSYNSVKYSTSLSADYHIWGCEWTSKGVSFYLDGKLLRSESYPIDDATTGWGGSRPADVLINLASGGGWPGSSDDKAAFPATLEVDYVRVYEKSGGGTVPGPDPDPDPDPGTGGGDEIISVLGPANVKQGQRVTVAVNFKAGAPRTIHALLQLSKSPWTTYKGATASKNIGAGKGTAYLTFTIPKNVPLGTNYQYQSYITETNKGWNQRKHFKAQRPITVIKDSGNSGVTADKVIWVSGPTNVKRGQQVTVVVKYKAETPRTIYASFQLGRSPWTTYKGATASKNVNAGTGKVSLTLTIPKNVSLGENYQYLSYITETNRGWNQRKHFNEQKSIKVIKDGGSSLSNEDKIIWASGPTNVKRGQRVTVTVKYKTKSPRTIVSTLQLGRKPWTTYKGATATKNVDAGTGKVNLTFTIPNNVPIGSNYQYQNFITERDRGWSKRVYAKEQGAVKIIK